jgi:hypothetical protein
MSATTDDGFNRPGFVKLSPAAIALAREFIGVAGAQDRAARIVTFEWTPSLLMREPGKPERDLGPCLLIGAYRRNEVPAAFIDMVGGLEVITRIPDEAWPSGALRLIDIDETRPFGVGLR